MRVNAVPNRTPSAVSVSYVGAHRSPVICVDNFAADPHGLVDQACDASFIDVGSRYPGVRAPVPAGYVSELLAKSASPIREVFGTGVIPELELCALSMVTTPAEKLRRIQRIPHFDGPHDGRIAFLHYLCEPFQGGTSFYRHRATGLCEITREHVARYQAAVVAELDLDDRSHSYVIDDTRHFERIFTVQAAFNRMIIYRGNALHSGDITGRTILSEDPRRGRLTINGFGFLNLQNDNADHDGSVRVHVV